MSEEDVFGFEYANLPKILQTNVVAPAFLGELFLPLLERGARKTIVNVSSSLGSIGVNLGKPYPTYSLTKTALNMLVWCFPSELLGAVLSADGGYRATSRRRPGLIS